MDLSARTSETKEVPEEFRNRFISGKGLGAALLLEKTVPCVEPFPSVNPLYFLFGALRGFAQGISRYAAVTKSPLTGTFVDSHSGGHFTTMVRYGDRGEGK